MTVLIAGGGIGGLTLALSLHQIGIAAKVFESVAGAQAARRRHQRAAARRARTDRTRPARQAGCSQACAPRNWRTFPSTASRSGANRAASRPVTNGRNSRFIAARCTGSCSMPRSNGWELRTFSPAIISPAGPRRPNGVRAEFIDKATGKPAGSHDGAVLIAADGIHSAIREKLYPQEGPPIWNGRILWRGITSVGCVPVRPHHDHGRP